MYICGIDYSISAPAVVKAKLDNNFKIVDLDYISFSKTLKQCKVDSKLLHNDKKKFANNFERILFLKNTINEFMYGSDAPTYVSIEGYAYGATGNVFDIAEATALTKSNVYEHGSALRIYTPSAIKKFATGKGTAKKVSMLEAYNAYEDLKIDVDHLKLLDNPQEDIIDAFWIMKLLQTELQLRHGMIELKSLTPKQIEVFNAVSKANPSNILSTDFIKKA